MANNQIVIFIILGITLILFAWGRLRHDLVATIALIAVVATGLTHPSEAFSGFGHAAVVTVAAVLVISHALRNSGVVDLIANALIPFTRNQFMHIVALTGVVTVASAFMNNVGALALLLPVALSTAVQHNRSPALLLMPLAFGSILGGMTTMIGTPPNVIIATYREEITGQAFSMFDFSPVGVVVTILGLAFVTLFGWKLIPRERLEKNAPQQLFAINEYLTEVRVPEQSALAGKPLATLDILDGEGVDIIGWARGNKRAMETSPDHILKEGDVLILRADTKGVKALIDKQGLELVTSATKSFYNLTSGELALAEGVISPGSSLDGRDVPYLRRRTGNTVALVALARQGEPVRRRLRRQTFEAGDVLLLQAETENIDQMMTHLGLLPLAQRELRIGKPRRVGLALGIFAAAIAAGILGLLPTAVAFLAAILAYVVLGILPMRDIYKEIDWPIIVLLGAMIPVGRALETTGATDLVANGIVDLTSGLPVALVLTLVLIVTMFLSDIINNAATALVMAPISVGIANELNVNPDAFLMAVAVGASCAFLTPIGHQSNTLVMGPGGYQFTDYWRMGLPLEAIIVAAGVPMILLAWPL